MEAPPLPVQPSARADVVALVQTEQRLEAMLAEARVEAATLVRSAQEAARQRAATLDAELATATEQLDAAIAIERRQAEERVDSAARRDVARYTSVDEREVSRLAGRVLELLVTPGWTP